jgi:uroporphyrinogen-III synthase
MTLYLGTDPSRYKAQGRVIHYPVIRLIPRDIPLSVFQDIPFYTHCIFTSRNTISILKEKGFPLGALQGKIIIAIGAATKARLEECNLTVAAVAYPETQEGVIELLKKMPPSYVFLPHATLARDVLERFLIESQTRYQICDLYDTVTHRSEPVPSLDAVDEIVFTSPSTVRAFFEIFSSLPVGKKMICLGPITQEALNVYLTRKE